MLYIIAPLAAILLGLITWIALSRQSSPAQRRAAVGALVLIALSVIVGMILIFSGPAGAAGPLIPVIAAPEPVQPEQEKPFSVLIFAILLLLLLGLIIFLALRKEKRRS